MSEKQKDQRFIENLRANNLRAVEAGGCAPPILVTPKDADRKLAEEGLWLWERNGDAGDKLYVEAIRRLLAAHPSACELVVDEAMFARLALAYMERHDVLQICWGDMAGLSQEDGTAALQHRGDSRGGEG